MADAKHIEGYRGFLFQEARFSELQLKSRSTAFLPMYDGDLHENAAASFPLPIGIFPSGEGFTNF
jgi:hypothetical protein